MIEIISGVPSKIRAFSLVEVSLVLVILGLLVGGVLAGQSLIHASELRSVITQHDNTYAAIRSFRDKYFALPGDMINATQFWGAAALAPGTCSITPSADPRTCNGDANGKVDFSAASLEMQRAWQHLANAGLIDGQYNGVDNTSTPRGKLGQSRWGFFDTGIMFSTWGYFNGEYNNTLYYGDPQGTQVFPTIRPEDAWGIDTKMDDGRPGAGKVVVTAANGLEFCTTATGAPAAKSAMLTASYLLTSTSVECALAFRHQF